jgi:Family of unknown function (DUF6298)/Putative collagen-binding domain of a collagenase
MAELTITEEAAGPLRAHPASPRYFTDGTKSPDGTLKAVYLTGSHTWNNLVDIGRNDPPEAFDFEAYLDFLSRYGHNFIRLWTWDSVVWDTRANGRLGKEFVHHVAPLPWARTGPGAALDGKPRFDLTQFDPVYFERLRQRAGAAGRSGIYLSIMLFEGWGLFHANRRPGTSEGWAWRAHPFHPENNINSIDGGKQGDPLSGEVHSLANPAVSAIQAAYIRKVVDTVNDRDNVLYEVINEGGQREWDWWVVDQIHEYERTRPRQHPVGITGHGAERLASMLASPADWISPGSADGFRDDPPAWEGKKVGLLDTDHVWGVGGSPAWVWKSFLRGHNPLFMDPYDGTVLGPGTREAGGGDTQWEPVRRAMGAARRLAERVSLASLQPRSDLASTQYCLADPGKEYLVYLPNGGEVTVSLAAGRYRFEWLNPLTGTPADTGSVTASGGEQSLQAPFAGNAVLHVKGTSEESPVRGK